MNKNNTPEIKNSVNTEQKTLDITAYIDAAQLLLAYVTESGLTIEHDTIATIVNAKHALEQHQWNSEIETGFWGAYNQLAKLAHPVSVASLKATRTFPKKTVKKPSPNKMSRFFFWSRQKERSTADQTIVRYQFLTMVILIWLIFTQIYWLMGSTITSQLTETLPQQLESLHEKRDELREHIPQEQWEETQELSEIEADIFNAGLQTDAQYKMLQDWNAVLRMFFIWPFSLLEQEQSSGTSQDEEQDYIISLQQSQFALKAIQLFLLPLQYGLLGAYAYILRQLTREIKTLTYVVESNISYRLRAQLGAVSGLAIGWFTTGTGIAVLGALSPLALAFLAGYSVEVLFTLMDKFVTSFSAKFSPDDKQKTLEKQEKGAK